MSDFPVVIGPQGAQVTAPSDLRAALVALAVSYSPGLTDNLPGSLIEDIASTDTGALVLVDQARVDLINSLTPYGANVPLLIQLGQLYGVPQGQATNTSVNVVFTGDPGFILAQGFIVSDGTNQYRLVDGGIIATDGSTSPLFAVCTLPGIFAVPSDTVNQLITSVPGTVTVTVNNPTSGTPGSEPEGYESYRDTVLTAGKAISQGMTTMLRTQLANVAGVQKRLVSARQVSGGGWQIIVGGGDPYEVANAIFMGLFDISSLKGSDIDSDRDITVSINDFPDTYNVVYVSPPQQIVGVALTWNTTLTNFTGDEGVAQQAVPALIAYVNSIYAGLPMNLFQLQDAFEESVAGLIPAALITRMVFNVTIDGVAAPPISGTGIIEGDPESFFFTDTTHVTVDRG